MVASLSQVEAHKLAKLPLHRAVVTAVNSYTSEPVAVQVDLTEEKDTAAR